jgi:hypothetical protein
LTFLIGQDVVQQGGFARTWTGIIMEGGGQSQQQQRQQQQRQQRQQGALSYHDMCVQC